MSHLLQSALLKPSGIRLDRTQAVKEMDRCLKLQNLTHTNLWKTTSLHSETNKEGITSFNCKRKGKSKESLSTSDSSRKRKKSLLWMYTNREIITPEQEDFLEYEKEISAGVASDSTSPLYSCSNNLNSTMVPVDLIHEPITHNETLLYSNNEKTMPRLCGPSRIHDSILVRRKYINECCQDPHPAEPVDNSRKSTLMFRDACQKHVQYPQTSPVEITCSFLIPSSEEEGAGGRGVGEAYSGNSSTSSCMFPQSTVGTYYNTMSTNATAVTNNNSVFSSPNAGDTLNPQFSWLSLKMEHSRQGHEQQRKNQPFHGNEEDVIMEDLQSLSLTEGQHVYSDNSITGGPTTKSEELKQNVRISIKKLHIHKTKYVR